MTTAKRAKVNLEFLLVKAEMKGIPEKGLLRSRNIGQVDLIWPRTGVAKKSGAREMVFKGVYAHDRHQQLLIGTNNFNLSPCKPENVKDGIVEIINEIRAKHPESRMLLLPVFVHGKSGEKPSASSRYMVLNEKYLPGLADGKTVFYHDINRKFLASDGTIPDGLLCDGLHLTTHGYSIWRKAVLPFFRENAESNPA